jgi:hypothetical protein
MDLARRDMARGDLARGDKARGDRARSDNCNLDRKINFRIGFFMSCLVAVKLVFFLTE